MPSGDPAPESRRPFRQYLAKMKGTKRTSPLPRPHHREVFISWLGAFVGIGLVAWLSLVYKMPLLVASFGASAVLIYGVPETPLAQPRNVIGGHFLSAVTAVLLSALFGATWWSIALGVSLAIALMLITHTAHPPGGATALVGILTKAHPSFILAPVTLGAVLLVMVGLLSNNLSPGRHYPKHWL